MISVAYNLPWLVALSKDGTLTVSGTPAPRLFGYCGNSKIQMHANLKPSLPILRLTHHKKFSGYTIEAIHTGRP